MLPFRMISNAQNYLFETANSKIIEQIVRNKELKSTEKLKSLQHFGVEMQSPI